MKPDYARGGPGPATILYVHYGLDWLRGSERVLLDLLRASDPARYRPMVWCNAPAMERAVADLGVPVVRSDFSVLGAYLPAPEGLAGLPRLVRRARSLIRQHGVRLVHVNSAAPAQWMVPAARLEGIPVVVHLHGAYTPKERHALLLHQADAVVGCARAVLTGLSADGVPSSRLHPIMNGVDLQRLRALPRVEVPEPAGEATLVSVGSLICRKGHDVSLRALRRLLDTGLRPRLVVAGSGDAEGNLRRLAAELGVEPQVVWLGERPDAPAFLRDVADVFVLASRDEALPLAILEAGAFDVPCVATDVGGVREVLEHGVNGLVVPPDDVDALAEALRVLMNGPAARRAMGAALGARVRVHHTVEAMGRAVQDLHGELLAVGAGTGLSRFRPRCLSSYARYGMNVLWRRLGFSAASQTDGSG